MSNTNELTPSNDYGPELFAQTDFASALAAIPEAAHLPDHSYAAVPALMRQIGAVADLATFARLAADPNTPAEALIFLAGICPAEFCANPVLPLLLLENPALPASFDPPSLGRLLSHEAVPTDLLAAIAHLGQPELAHAARLHIGLAGEAGPDWEAQLEVAVAGLTDLPKDDLLALLLLLGLVPPWLQARASAETSARPRQGPLPRQPILVPEAADQAQLARMLADNSPRERARAAADPRTRPELLAQAKADEDWGDGDYGVFEALATNPATPAAVLIELAADRKALATGVRRAVACNPSSPPEALDLLAEETQALDVPLALAAHGNLAPEQRQRMVLTARTYAARSFEPFYQAIALTQPDTPTATLVEHVLSPYWLVRLSVARAPATPAEVRQRLTRDGNQLVRAAARAHGEGGEL